MAVQVAAGYLKKDNLLATVLCTVTVLERCYAPVAEHVHRSSVYKPRSSGQFTRSNVLVNSAQMTDHYVGVTSLPLFSQYVYVTLC